MSKPITLDFTLMITDEADEEGDMDLPDAMLMVEFDKWNEAKLMGHLRETLDFLKKRLEADPEFTVKDATFCT